MRLRPSQFCVALAFTALGTATPCAAQTTPRLQDALIRAKDGTITITRLPIHTPAGTIYRDVTIELQVDASGNVTLNTDRSGHALVQGMPGGAPTAKVMLSAPIQLAQKPSAPLVLQHFTPGTYEAAGSPLVKLAARDPDNTHGLPTWSLTTIGDADGPIQRATFFSGPASLTPIAHRLDEAGIDSTQYAYGTAAVGSTMAFGGGALIGAIQQGRTLTIVSFRQGCCSAASEPTSRIVFTRVGGGG